MSHICLLPPLKWSPKEPPECDCDLDGAGDFESQHEACDKALAAYKESMILVENPYEIVQILIYELGKSSGPLLIDESDLEKGKVYSIDCEAVIKKSCNHCACVVNGDGTDGQCELESPCEFWMPDGHTEVVTLSPKRDEQRPKILPGMGESKVTMSFPPYISITNLDNPTRTRIHTPEEEAASKQLYDNLMEKLKEIKEEEQKPDQFNIRWMAGTFMQFPWHQQIDIVNRLGLTRDNHLPSQEQLRDWFKEVKEKGKTAEFRTAIIENAKDYFPELLPKIPSPVVEQDKGQEPTVGEMSIEDKTKFFEAHLSPLIRYGYNSALLDINAFAVKQIDFTNRDAAFQSVVDEIGRLMDAKKTVDWDKLKIEIEPKQEEPESRDKSLRYKIDIILEDFDAGFHYTKGSRDLAVDRIMGHVTRKS